LNGIVEDALEGEPGNKQGVRAILVLYKGAIVSEKYAKGFNKNSLHQGWSMTKSLFNNAVIGILMKMGKIKLKSSGLIDTWSNDERSKITIENLLGFNSGLEWNEAYNGETDVTRMLYNSGSMGEYASKNKMTVRPGTEFHYSSGSANILSMIIRNSIADSEYYNFPYHYIYDKLGMFSLVLEPDANGTFVSSSYSIATARDWARFGLFFMNDGYWNKEQILPEGWVKYTTTPVPGANYGEYGAQFWLNRGAPGNPSFRLYPGAPPDMFWAEGFQGQRLFIIPSREIVVVRLSLTLDSPLNDDIFLKHILDILPKEN
jgi:CubicO group peptidase (beta-lactamase class C family)